VIRTGPDGFEIGEGVTMSTQLKTRPESRTIERPAETREPTVHEPAPGSSRRQLAGWTVFIAALAVVGLSLVAMNALTNDTATSTPSNVPAFDSPGGNSLNLPTTGTDAYVPAFDSPGGNSLNDVGIATLSQVPAFNSPGGNSLNIP